MSREWPGGLIRKTPVIPTGPFGNGAAPGVWTLDQMNYWLKQNLWPIAGNFLYIEDVFSTWLYTGNGSTQTITNGIRLAGAGGGGLVWIKGRSAATDHALYDTARGATFDLASNLNTGQTTQSTGLASFLASGFNIGSLAKINTGSATYASWTFRKQPKFFDVVTYTGNGANRTIAHSLGSVPGCIMVKRTDTTGDWQVYHRSLANTQYMVLNTTAAAATGATRWNSTTPTDTIFSLGTDATVNANGGTYVAYLFAHDAGGFGATGTDNVISCGTYAGTSASGNTITLGYEPQWILIKQATPTSANQWVLFDNMRGWTTEGSDDNYLFASTFGSETSIANYISPTATGFSIQGTSGLTNASGFNYIYIAIRRGPMRTPTSGTSVFSPLLSSAATGTNLTTNFPVDLQIASRTAGTTNGTKGVTLNRLRGISTTSTNSGQVLLTHSTNSETTVSNSSLNWGNTGFQMPSLFASGSTIFWNFGRAPGFFDVVCYTGDGNPITTYNHNLGVQPEMIFVKQRDSSGNNWAVMVKTGASTWVTSGSTGGFVVNSSNATTVTQNYNSSFTSTLAMFGVVGAGYESTNISGATYVAHLFASCPGVSKIGTYTGTGATQTINCGFAAGARFVLIKRTDSTGDWYVWDSVRGIVAGNDPYLLLNSTAAEVTTTDWVDTAASGFELSNAGGNLVNTNGAGYIFLAIS